MGQSSGYIKGKKLGRPTTREMNTAVYLLRAVQLGLTINDLEQLDEGMVVDMLTESANDSAEYQDCASQEDMDRF